MKLRKFNIMKKSLIKYYTSKYNYDTFYSYLYENSLLKITFENELFTCDVCGRISQEKYYSQICTVKDVDVCYLCGDTNKYIKY